MEKFSKTKTRRKLKSTSGSYLSLKTKHNKTQQNPAAASTVAHFCSLHVAQP
jgi:hypothetical protein